MQLAPPTQLPRAPLPCFLSSLKPTSRIPPFRPMPIGWSQAFDGKQDPECMMLEAALNDEEDQEVYFDVQAQAS